MKCAASAAISVSARSGGHSYAAYGLGGQDGSLIVDLSLLKNITLDKSNGLAVSGTGNTLGSLATYIYNNGQRVLPHGTCPYVMCFRRLVFLIHSKPCNIRWGLEATLLSVDSVCSADKPVCCWIASLQRMLSLRTVHLSPLPSRPIPIFSGYARLPWMNRCSNIYSGYLRLFEVPHRRSAL